MMKTTSAAITDHNDASTAITVATSTPNDNEDNDNHDCDNNDNMDIKLST